MRGGFKEGSLYNAPWENVLEKGLRKGAVLRRESARESLEPHGWAGFSSADSTLKAHSTSSGTLEHLLPSSRRRVVYNFEHKLLYFS